HATEAEVSLLGRIVERPTAVEVGALVAGVGRRGREAERGPDDRWNLDAAGETTIAEKEKLAVPRGGVGQGQLEVDLVGPRIRRRDEAHYIAEGGMGQRYCSCGHRGCRDDRGCAGRDSLQRCRNAAQGRGADRAGCQGCRGERESENDRSEPDGSSHV